VQTQDERSFTVSKSLKSLFSLVAALTVASALYAQNSDGGWSMTQHGMMGHHGMADGKNMMGQMSQMMDHCNQMMGRMGSQGSKPNEQWRQPTPKVPEKRD
jgi:hypothetical protein